MRWALIERSVSEDVWVTGKGLSSGSAVETLGVYRCYCVRVGGWGGCWLGVTVQEE